MLSASLCSAAAVGGLLAPLPVSKLRLLGGKFGEEVMGKLQVNTVGELVSLVLKPGRQRHRLHAALVLQRAAVMFGRLDGRRVRQAAKSPLWVSLQVDTMRCQALVWSVCAQLDCTIAAVDHFSAGTTGACCEHPSLRVAIVNAYLLFVACRLRSRSRAWSLCLGYKTQLGCIGWRKAKTVKT
jgi:hypothetical protein